MKMMIPLLLLFLSGCGDASFIDARFQPYVDSFVERANNHQKKYNLVGLDIVFGETLGDAGKCNIYQKIGKNDEILINEKIFNRMDEIHRKYLIFHEMGHCVFGKKHVEDQHDVMYPKWDLILYEPEGEEAFLETVFK